MFASTDAVKTPKIGLIATLLSTVQTYRGAGIHIYSHQLLHHLPQQDRSLQYLAFTGDKDFVAPTGMVLHESTFPIRHPYGRILWEQTIVPLTMRGQHVDLAHGLAYAIPRIFSIPSVVTVHDLSFLHYPQIFRPTNRLYLSRITALSCKRARRVIAVSQATKADLQRLLHIPATKIDVIYNGVDSMYRHLSSEEVATYRKQKGWPKRFILTLGTLEPRKNHVALFEAYAQYRQLSRHPLPLLVGGGKGWHYGTIFKRVDELNLQSHVHFLGFVPAEALPWLYNAASLFVYPSLYEGFGLPVAEAMACGTPAITSTASSLPEVAGKAALVIDPDDTDALASAMMNVLENDDQSLEMRNMGFLQSRRFSWDTTASDTAALYRRVMERV